MQPISLSTFYPDTIVGARDDPKLTAPVPAVDVLVALVASVLLALAMKLSAALFKMRCPLGSGALLHSTRAAPLASVSSCSGCSVALTREG